MLTDRSTEKYSDKAFQLAKVDSLLPVVKRKLIVQHLFKKVQPVD
jgi:hypothetical protein